jgi:regulatory protein
LSKALEVEQAAIQLLTVREHSRYELQRKLNRRYTDEALVELTLDGLEESGLLSDGRFTEQYVNQRMRKGYGPLRIRQELQERGIASELSEACLDLNAKDWQNLLNKAAQRKFGLEKPEGQREQARHARFLQGRGFPEGMIRGYLWD